MTILPFPSRVPPMSDPDSALTWYIARTATQREGRAVEALTELGFSVYLPQLTRWHRLARAKKRIHRPLFPGYLFVGIDHDRQSIYEATNADGVHAFLRLGTPEPRALAYDVVQAFRSAEAMGLFDKTRRTRKEPAAGSEVRIIAGKFQGFPAQFVERRADERIEVLIQMLGRWSKLLLKAEEVSGFGEEDAA